MNKKQFTPTKMKSLKKFRWPIRVLFFFLAFIGVTVLYFIGMEKFRSSREPDSSSNCTTQTALYPLSRLRSSLFFNPLVKSAAFGGRAAELEYGTYVIPGLESTLTQVEQQRGSHEICTSMTPQGLAVTEDYLLISAYCHSDTHSSVIYVIDKQTHAFLKEIVLRNKSHVGGLAYDSLHKNIWIACSDNGIAQVNAITLAQLEQYDFTQEYNPITYSQSYDLYAITRNSFLTYHNNALYIGYFTSKSASVLETYNIMDDGTLATQLVDPSFSFGFTTPLTPIALPSDTHVITKQAQGVTFYKDKILISHSYGILPSTLQVFPNSFRKLLEDELALKTIRFPERLEQIYADGDDLYVLFESAAYGYRATSFIKFDRVLKLNLNKLLGEE